MGTSEVLEMHHFAARGLENVIVCFPSMLNFSIFHAIFALFNRFLMLFKIQKTFRAGIIFVNVQFCRSNDVVERST